RQTTDINAAILARRRTRQPREERDHALAVGHRPNDYGLNFPGAKVSEDLAPEVVAEGGRLLALLDQSHQAAGLGRRAAEGGAGEQRIRLRHAEAHICGGLPEHGRTVRQPGIWERQSDSASLDLLH